MVYVFPIVALGEISTLRIPLNVISDHYKQTNGLEDRVFGHLKNWWMKLYKTDAMLFLLVL